MTFWLIVVTVNVVLQAAAVVALRRPLANEIEPTAGDHSLFSDGHRALVTTIHEQAGRRGFRWFGVMMVKTWPDKPAHPAAIWWNGDLGAWVTFESLGRKWNIELSADVEDGSKLSVSKVGIAHLAVPPSAVLVTKARIRSFDDLWAALPVSLEHLPTHRGWPAPGREWAPMIERRDLLLRHWVATGRAAKTEDGRGVRISFVAANVFVVLAGFGVRHAIQAWTNRRSRDTLIALCNRLGLAAVEPPPARVG